MGVPMLFRSFTDLLLEDLREEARPLSLSPKGQLAFAGACQAIAECRLALASKRSRTAMMDLLQQAGREERLARAALDPRLDFWSARCRQVDTVADVLSVVLAKMGHPVLVEPSTAATSRCVGMLGLRHSETSGGESRELC